jgi:hypothetical protein
VALEQVFLCVSFVFPVHYVTIALSPKVTRQHLITATVRELTALTQYLAGHEVRKLMDNVSFTCINGNKYKSCMD